MTTKRIGWQKYEDLLEQQINSPIIEMLTSSISNLTAPIDPIDESDEFSPQNEYDEITAQVHPQPFLSIPEDISNEIQLTANFDCWMGHTNFNITNDVRNKLNKVRGVEVLKICSRYRFFIGTGKMFDFSEVRKEIEDTLL